MAKNSRRESPSSKTPSAASAPLNLQRTIVEDDRTGMSQAAIRRAILDNLFYQQGVEQKDASLLDYYLALSYTIRDRLVNRWIKSRKAAAEAEAKSVYYLSAEFLMGRQLGNNLLNAGCFQQARHALSDLGVSIYDVLDQEPEPGLGNGGLGRLAACFLDSLATMSIPAVGYGIRYEFGIFRQSFKDGWQVEHPDKWLANGNPWELVRPQQAVSVGFGGRTEWRRADGGHKVVWLPERVVLGTPYDTMIPGHGTDTVDTLRLWSASTTNDFDFGIFNAGDYDRAVAEKTSTESISKVLYPNDSTPQGRDLRLKQQYFFVACSLADIVRNHFAVHGSLSNLHEKAAVQMNDTHPSIAVAELMRILVDIHGMEWDEAWTITRGTLGYTNHTLMGEALERWPVAMFQWLLPRHLEIIYEINSRFLGEVRARFPQDDQRARRMSIIEEGQEKQIRMANLATVGSHAVNGVAKLHSDLLKQNLLNDFYQMWPDRFSNKTNGVTPRRWMMLANPKLTFLITERIGKGWLRNLDELRKLEAFAGDETFGEMWRIFKNNNKSELGDYIRKNNGVTVDPDSMFDVQVKRLHEYKRQLLQALHIITLYRRIKHNPNVEVAPRTFIFGAKAAPGYYQAKLIIKLINSIGDLVNHDPDVRGRLKVVFLANYCVSLGERVYPSADLSEQISTAGTEASGTGNMKFSLNGALTVGTLDGANIEIRNAVGPENFFLFGHTVEQLRELRSSGYWPRSYYDRNPMLKEVIDFLWSDDLTKGQRGLFGPIVDALLGRDDYFHCADYQSFIDVQDQIGSVWRDQAKWTRLSIMNVARMGYFSSDRTIGEYCEEIWGAKPVQVAAEDTHRAQGSDE